MSNLTDYTLRIFEPHLAADGTIIPICVQSLQATQGGYARVLQQVRQIAEAIPGGTFHITHHGRLTR